MAFPTNFVRIETKLQAQVRFQSFQPFQLGRGNTDTYSAGWIEITDQEVIVFDVYLRNKTLEEDAAIQGDAKEVKTIRALLPQEVERFAHGLDFGGIRRLQVIVDAGQQGAALSIITRKGKFIKQLPKWWAGGEPFIRNLGQEPITGELAFERKYADRDIWFMGASYFNSTSPARWPYYMRQEGYTQWMADHLPGGNAVRMLPCFKHDLKFGKPKIVVWDLQGNDASDEGLTPNPKWVKAVEEFVAICKEHKITPVFTLSCAVSSNRRGKDKWIKDHGFRYVDVPAVMDDHVTPEGFHVWKDPRWLGSDKVHPTKEGAAVMWTAYKKALPELKK
ncbi:MAG: SGNH/GDSL hydrolase family protein [Bacteroidales bacterium]|nr:SGNH/GDSL hydrolase family protein [Bacteroidales bacterium]